MERCSCQDSPHSHDVSAYVGLEATLEKDSADGASVRVLKPGGIQKWSTESGAVDELIMQSKVLRGVKLQLLRPPTDMARMELSEEWFFRSCRVKNLPRPKPAARGTLSNDPCHMRPSTSSAR